MIVSNGKNVRESYTSDKFRDIFNNIGELNNEITITTQLYAEHKKDFIRARDSNDKNKKEIFYKFIHIRRYLNELKALRTLFRHIT